MTLISVIIPARNAEATLGATLDSVQAQAGVRVETIVVDDGSIDRTREIATRHAIAPTVVAGRRAGAAAARNTGLAASSGGAIVFLDADDLLKPGALAGRLRALEEEGPDTLIVTDHVQLLDGRERPSLIRPELGDDQCGALIRSNRMTVHAVLAPRALLDRVPGPFVESLRVYEDWALWLRLVLLGARIRVEEVPDCIYRIRSAGMTTEGPRARRDAVRLMEMAEDWIAESPRENKRSLELARRQMLRHYLRIEARACARRGNLVRAVPDAVRALLIEPRDVLPYAWQTFHRKRHGLARRLAGRRRKAT